MTEFRTGAALSDPDDRDWFFHESKLAGARPVFGEGSIDWRPIWTPRVQVANDCVAFDTAQKVWLCSQLHDPTPIPFPSPLFLYSQAVRLMTGGDFYDEGSQHRYVLKVARDAGFVPEADWPELAENIALVPPGHLYTDALCATLEAFYRIPDLRDCNRRGLPPPSVQIVEAMRRGYPVGRVSLVNRPYAEQGKRVWAGPVHDDGEGAWEGYHAETIGVWNEPERLFGIFGSWGADKGDEGVYWVTEAALNAHSAEFWVAKHAPGDL